jgi:hypothetical protein
MSIPLHHPVFEKTATKALSVLFFSLLLGLCIPHSAFRIFLATTRARKFRGEPAGGTRYFYDKRGRAPRSRDPEGKANSHDLRCLGPCGHVRHRGERDAHLHLRRRAQPARIEHACSLATATATICHGSSALRLGSRASRVDAHRRSRVFCLTISDKLFQKRLNSAELDKFIRKTAEAHFIWFQEGRGGG